MKKRKAEDELTAAAASAAPIVATKAPLPAGGGGGDGDDNDNDDNDDNDDDAAHPGKQKKKEKSFLSKRAKLLAAAAEKLCPQHAQKLIRDAGVAWQKNGYVSVIFVLPRLFCAYNLFTF